MPSQNESVCLVVALWHINYSQVDFCLRSVFSLAHNAAKYAARRISITLESVAIHYLFSKLILC